MPKFGLDGVVRHGVFCRISQRVCEVVQTFFSGCGYEEIDRSFSAESSLG